MTTDEINKLIAKLICFFTNHKYKIINTTNGNVWGWNILKCERCCKKINTLTD